MTLEQSAQLRVGSRVSVIDAFGPGKRRAALRIRVYGTVCERGFDYVVIQWDRKDIGNEIRSTRWLRDLDDVEVAESALPDSEAEALASTDTAAGA